MANHQKSQTSNAVLQVCLLTVSTQMKNIHHFGYNACLINFIFCSSSRSLEHFIYSLILINYYCNISIFLFSRAPILSVSTTHCKIPVEHDCWILKANITKQNLLSYKYSVLAINKIKKILWGVKLLYILYNSHFVKYLNEQKSKNAQGLLKIN